MDLQVDPESQAGLDLWVQSVRAGRLESPEAESNQEDQVIHSSYNFNIVLSFNL